MIIVINLKCFDCGFCQSTEAINPEFDGDQLVQWYMGSSGFYCDECGGSNLIQLGFSRVQSTDTVV